MPYTGIHRGTIQFYSDSLRIGEFEVQRFEVGLDAGITNRYGEIKLGPYFHHVQTTPDFGLLTPIFSKETTSQVGVRLNVVYDQLDTLSFPRSGSHFSGRIITTKEAWGSDEEYSLAQLKFTTAKSAGAHTFLGRAEWGDEITSVNDLPIYLAFKLGGPGRLSGLNLQQLTGSRYSLASMSYYYQYDRLPSQLGKGLYMGMSLETGKINDVFLQDDSKYNSSASIYWGADTILGSVYLGYGMSDLDQRTFYLVISNTYF
jgi:NTE family protein